MSCLLTIKLGIPSQRGKSSDVGALGLKVTNGESEITEEKPLISDIFKIDKRKLQF